jgi:hypothetical protein
MADQRSPIRSPFLEGHAFAPPITEEMEGHPMTAAIFWRRPGYELFLEMQAFAATMPEAPPGSR